MNSQALAAKPIEDLLDLIIKSVGLDLQYAVASPPAGANGGAAELKVVLSGPDASLLTERNGELLHAIEHIAAKILNLESEDHERICFDAQDFKVQRDQDLQHCAEAAIAQVRRTGEPFAFPPMTSRERRMLHLALASSGMTTASSGESARRFVVLYPEAKASREPVATVQPARSSHIRSAFRPRAT